MGGRRARSALLVISLLVATTSCRRDPKKELSPARQELPPLAASTSSVPLAVAGFGDAVLSAPSGATSPAPVLVAVLGIGDTPESQCAVWRDLIGQRAFVLCPRGRPHLVFEDSGAGRAEPSDGTAAPEGAEVENGEPHADSRRTVQVGFYPSDAEAVEREVAAGLAALRARHGAHVSAGPAVYAGFSRGAFLGAVVTAKNPVTFPRAVLIEGGQSAWTDETAGAFAKSGGKRILFACGRPSCVVEAEAAVAVLGRHHIETRIVHGEGEGHGYKKQVKDQLRASFDWVTEGDPVWRQLVATTSTR